MKFLSMIEEGVQGVTDLQGVYHPSLDTLKMCTSTYDMKLDLETRSKISLSSLAFKEFLGPCCW